MDAAEAHATLAALQRRLAAMSATLGAIREECVEVETRVERFETKVAMLEERRAARPRGGGAPASPVVATLRPVPRDPDPPPPSSEGAGEPVDGAVFDPKISVPRPLESCTLLAADVAHQLRRSSTLDSTTLLSLGPPEQLHSPSDFVELSIPSIAQDRKLSRPSLSNTALLADAAHQLRRSSTTDSITLISINPPEHSPSDFVELSLPAGIAQDRKAAVSRPSLSNAALLADAAHQLRRSSTLDSITLISINPPDPLQSPSKFVELALPATFLHDSMSHPPTLDPATLAADAAHQLRRSSTLDSITLVTIHPPDPLQSPSVVELSLPPNCSSEPAA
eukprot:EG_transcript_16895